MQGHKVPAPDPAMKINLLHVSNGIRDVCKCVLFGDFGEGTATSSGYILDCRVFRSPSPS